MSIQVKSNWLLSSMSLLLATFTLMSCKSSPEAMLYVEPEGAKIAAGSTVTIGVRVANAPTDVRYVWRAKRGQLNPQESTDRLSTKYLAPQDQGEDIITLEIKSGDSVLWTGDKVVEVIKGDAPPPRSTTDTLPSSIPTNQQITITNFSGGGQWGAFFSPGQGKAKDSIVLDADQIRGRVFSIEYDVSNSGNYSGAWIKFALPNFQPNQWSVVSFWLRGDGQAEYTKKLKVELKMKESNWGWRNLYISNVTDKWQQFRLRLSDFDRIDDWDKSNEFVLTFENSEATALRGKLYLDQIAFEQ
jgi:hypothetical protein